MAVYLTDEEKFEGLKLLKSVECHTRVIQEGESQSERVISRAGNESCVVCKWKVY